MVFIAQNSLLKRLMVCVTIGQSRRKPQKKNKQKKIVKYFEDILLTKDQEELLKMIENLGDVNIQYFNPNGTRIYDDLD